MARAREFATGFIGLPSQILFKSSRLPHILGVLASMLVAVLASSVNPLSAATSEKEPPKSAEVGVWFDAIHSIDFLDGSYGAEFYLWWVSADPDFRPFEIFQLLNGRQWDVKAISRRTLPDGSFYTSGIVSAKLNHDWQLEYYPFDRQTLRLVIETPFPSTELRLVPNSKESTISDLMHVEGFKVTGISLEERVESYNTSFGLREQSGNKYSRLVISLGLVRESGRLVVAILIGFIVANIIALLTYAIHVSNLGVRASMVGSAIFGGVGNMYFLARELHPAVGSLLVDRFAVGTFTAIIIALLNSIIVERLMKRNKSHLAHSVNRTVFYFVLFGSLAFYLVAFLGATQWKL